MGYFQALILTLFIVLFHIHSSKGCASCPYPKACSKQGSECCINERMLGRCMIDDKAVDFKTAFRDNSPDSYWPLSDPLADQIMSTKTATLNGQTPINNGVLGKALQLKGDKGLELSDYKDTCLANTSMGLTVSLWLKYGNATSESQTFFTLGEDTTTEGGDRLQITQPNKTVDEIGVLLNSERGRLSIRFPSPWNIWTHIVVTWDKENSFVIYRNGNPITSGNYDICFGCNTTHSGKVYLGESENAKAPNATVDELAVWCKVLNGTAVKQIYDYYKGPPGFYLVAKIAATIRNDFSTKVKSHIPSAEVSSPTCPDQSCNVNVFVSAGIDGDALSPLIVELGADLKEYYITVVPQPKVRIKGQSSVPTELIVTWEIDDDKKFSMFQHYNLSLVEKATSTHVLTISRESYDLDYKFVNLTAYTEYNITVKQCFLGGACKSSTINVTTAEKAPGPPENAEAITVNSTCIKVQFKKPKEPSGLMRKIVILYRQVDSPSDQPAQSLEAETDQQDSFEHDVCDLTANTKYTFNVSLVTIAPGKSTNNVIGRTQGPVPATSPPNVVSHNATSPYDDTSTCKVTWDMLPSSESNGNLSSFRIEYHKEGSNEMMYAEIGICNTTKIITDLQYYSKYSVTVSATNTHGIGPPSTPVFCYTAPLVPSGPPQNLTAICTTSTSINVKWGTVAKELQNGLILGYNVTYHKHDDEANVKYMVVNGGDTLQTEITGLMKFTEYNISITAFNSKGTGNETTYANTSAITCEDVPEGPPTDLKVLEKSNISCTISWTGINSTMANGIIKGYEVTANDTNNTDSQTNFVGTVLTCGLNATFEDLKPYRIYEVKASGFNSKGSSAYSEVMECMTDEGPPLIPPPNLKCTPKTSRILEVCWDEIPMIQQQGIVREYIVEYRYVNESFSSTPQKTTSTNLCTDVIDLEEYSKYSLKVKAVTVLEGNFTETPIECMTKEGLPTTAPNNVTGYNKSAYSLQLYWSGLPLPPPGILRHFVLYYRIWNASEDTTKNITFPETTREYLLEGLELYTMYCVQVAGYTVGVGPRSTCANISTDDKWLPPPETKPEKVYQMAESTTKNCSIEWTKANNTDPDPDSHIIGYVIFYRFFGTNDTWKEQKVESAATTKYVLQDLEEYSKYEIRVAGYNIYGVGNKSVMLLCETKEDAPSAPPQNITGINASSTSISLNWNIIAKFERNGRLRQFCILLWIKGRRNETEQKICIEYREPVDNNNSIRKKRAITIDPNTKIISGLDKFTTYGIQIYGVTVADGPKSETIWVTTAEDAPTAPVRNLTVTNSSSSSLFLTWSNIPSENIPGILRYFVVFYWKADWPIVDKRNVTLPIDDVRHNATRRSRRSVTIPPTAEFKFNMSGLEIWTNYTIQVAGFTVSTGVPSNEITASTDEDKPCLPPNNIRFSVPMYTSLQVHWDKVLRNCTNGIIRGYRLIYQEMSPNGRPITVNLTTDQKTYIIEDMNMEVNYTVELLAYTSKGDGNVSFDLARPDKTGPKHSPINVTAENITSPTQIPVSWKPIVEPGLEEKLLGYKVSWRVVSEGLEEKEEQPWETISVRKDSLYHTIERLKNFVHYQVEVSGFTRGGYGPSGITFADTCRCFRRIATNYRVFAPYNAVQISPNRKKVNMSGMIPAILNNLAITCCQSCKSHGSSYVDFINNGHNKTAFQYNELDVVNLIDNTNDLSFPIYGWKWQDTYEELYRFIPLVDSPGFAFLLMEPQTESPLRSIVMSIIETWPYLLIVCILALVAGIIMWFLDTSYNEEHFPHSYFKGIANGWWWAFISMTTLGYGDKVPSSDRSKAFAVVWVLMGLVIFGIFSGAICTAFTTVIYQSSTQLYGSEVAAIYNTPEYRFGVRRSAKVNTHKNYTRFDDVLQALLDGEVKGMLMDAYEAGTKAKEFERRGKGRIRVQKVFNYASTFGVVLAGPSTRLYQCSREWMSANRAEMSVHIARYMGVVEEDTINEMVEIATGLFDANSPTFKDFLKYSLIAGGGLVGLGLLWEIYYNVSKKKKNKLEATSEAFIRKDRLTKEMGNFTKQFLEQLMHKISELKEKHEEEQQAFRRNNKHLLKKKTKGKLLQLELLFRNDHTHTVEM